MNQQQLRRAIEQLLASQPDNQRLRDNLEGLSRDPLFSGLTWHWGPRLYARSKATFRPFILNRFSEWITADNRWTRVAWADHGADLEAWLETARAGRDGVLVRRLQRWKYAAPRGWGLDVDRWNAALVAAYRAAPLRNRPRFYSLHPQASARRVLEPGQAGDVGQARRPRARPWRREAVF